MLTHLFPIKSWDSHFIYLPPEGEFTIPRTEKITHKNRLYLNRGMHLLNEWWKTHNIIVSYPIAENATYQLEVDPELEKLIRKMHHEFAPHQHIADRELVFGLGATQLIHAALYASGLDHSAKNGLIDDNRVQISTLYATQNEPGYIEYGSLIELMHLALISWVRRIEADFIDPKHLLEFITTPNNPDGRIIKQSTEALWTIHDRVNHWPFFLSSDASDFYSETLEKDQISIFSLSKVLSFSGSRLGYAFVKDPQIAHYMRHYILMATHGLVSDSQFRAIQALKYLMEGHLKEYADWIRQKLKTRWEALEKAVKNTDLQLMNTQGPAAWVKTEGNARELLLKKYNAEGTVGTEYGASESFERLNMLCGSDEFDEFIWRLNHK